MDWAATRTPIGVAEERNSISTSRTMSFAGSWRLCTLMEPVCGQFAGSWRQRKYVSLAAFYIDGASDHVPRSSIWWRRGWIAFASVMGPDGARGAFSASDRHPLPVCTAAHGAPVGVASRRAVRPPRSSGIRRSIPAIEVPGLLPDSIRPFMIAPINPSPF